MPAESRRVLQHRAEQFVALGQVPQFKELQAEAVRKRDRILRVASKVLLSPEPVDQRRADYHRGFVDGMKYLTQDVIEGAERALERLDRGTSQQPEAEEGSDVW